MRTFKLLTIKGVETEDPVKQKVWRFSNGEFYIDSGFMLITQPALYITADTRLTTIISLSEISQFQEHNK